MVLTLVCKGQGYKLIILCKNSQALDVSNFSCNKNIISPVYNNTKGIIQIGDIYFFITSKITNVRCLCKNPMWFIPASLNIQRVFVRQSLELHISSTLYLYTHIITSSLYPESSAAIYWAPSKEIYLSDKPPSTRQVIGKINMGV